MTPYTIALLVGVAITAVIQYNQPRVLLWLLFGTINFILTYTYALQPLPWLPHAFVTGLGDAALIIGVTLLTGLLGPRAEWEKWVRRAFMLSVLFSMARLFGWLPDRTTYAIALEGCNWLALLVMGGHGLLRLADEKLYPDVVGQAARAGLGVRLHRARVFLDKTSRCEGILARSQ